MTLWPASTVGTGETYLSAHALRTLIAVAGFGGAVSAGTALKTGSPAESRSSPFRASERLHERSPSPSARGY